MTTAGRKTKVYPINERANVLAGTCPNPEPNPNPYSAHAPALPFVTGILGTGNWYHRS